MKIALHIPVWKRVELTRACYVGLQRIQKEFQENGAELVPYIAVSEDEHEQLAQEFGWNYKWFANERLGTKNNELLDWMRDFSWDFMLQLGSDDFILPGGGAHIVELMKEHEFAGSRNIYMFRADTREGTLFRGYASGAGRFMARRLVDKVQVMWTDRQVGLDGCSRRSVWEKTKVEPFWSQTPTVADVKSSVNVSAFARYKYSPENYDLDEVVPEAHLIPRDVVLKLE
jgi:hypothetical protein